MALVGLAPVPESGQLRLLISEDDEATYCSGLCLVDNFYI